MVVCWYSYLGERGWVKKDEDGQVVEPRRKGSKDLAAFSKRVRAKE